MHPAAATDADPDATPDARTPVAHLLARMRIGADLARLGPSAGSSVAVAVLPSFASINGRPAWVTWSGPGELRSVAPGGTRLTWSVRGSSSSPVLSGTGELDEHGVWTGELPPGAVNPRAFSPHAQALASFAADAAMAQWELVQRLAPNLAYLARAYTAAQFVLLDTDPLVRHLRFGISWRSAPSPLGRALAELVATDDLARSDVDAGVLTLVGDLVRRRIDEAVHDVDLSSVLTRVRESPAPSLAELIQLWSIANPTLQVHPEAFVAAIARATALPPSLATSLAEDAARHPQAG
ncbi:hypothetical protein C5E06_09660 [Pseudoclavibacter sp. RFBI5]|uniref:hypothetical protein n=1 Tax=Pseudoclavibacter sp. RFBI5 TaxID=2080578 RepID=UPI000CE8CE38|nr:hypothetical protein [Pseudoclavibacter sp. RFBI5]PPG02710.1 hypothetical protein C5E06_09660 [Pseudoclavibacter sp. RFBI5]